jgi:hypothetical protein
VAVSGGGGRVVRVASWYGRAKPSPPCNTTSNFHPPSALRRRPSRATQFFRTRSLFRTTCFLHIHHHHTQGRDAVGRRWSGAGGPVCIIGGAEKALHRGHRRRRLLHVAAAPSVRLRRPPQYGNRPLQLNSGAAAWPRGRLGGHLCRHQGCWEAVCGTGRGSASAGFGQPK